MAILGRKKAPPINPSRVQLRRLMEEFAATTKAGMLVLDAGAGTSPYRSLFDHARYEAADFAQVTSTHYAPLDYVCDLTAIPVEDGRFDRIVCNQVLEHLPEPPRAMAELFRVTAPGGTVFLSAPLFYAEHQQPYDYFRYTRFALRKLFEDAGYVVTEVLWMEGYFGTVAYQFQQMSRALPKDLAATRELCAGWRTAYLWPAMLGVRALARVLQRFFAYADVNWKYVGHGLPKNYVVLARKPRAKK